MKYLIRASVDIESLGFSEDDMKVLLKEAKYYNGLWDEYDLEEEDEYEDEEEVNQARHGFIISHLEEYSDYVDKFDNMPGYKFDRLMDELMKRLDSSKSRSKGNITSIEDEAKKWAKIWDQEGLADEFDVHGRLAKNRAKLGFVVEHLLDDRRFSDDADEDKIARIIGIKNY